MKVTVKGSPTLPPSRIASIEYDMDNLGLRDVYDELVAGGMSPTLAQMVASRKACNLGTTDSEFNRRERDRMLSMDEGQRDEIVDIAHKAGVKTHGRTYNGQLGKYGDQDAWVSDTHDVKATAAKKGYSIRGMVNVDCEEKPVEKTRIAPDILDRLETQARVKDPELNRKVKGNPEKRHELRTALTEKHTKPV